MKKFLFLLLQYISLTSDFNNSFLRIIKLHKNVNNFYSLNFSINNELKNMSLNLNDNINIQKINESIKYNTNS